VISLLTHEGDSAQIHFNRQDPLFTCMNKKKQFQIKFLFFLRKFFELRIFRFHNSEIVTEIKLDQ
jgi:hypothetical protein